jgi:serine/threonine protein kinase/DNA-binding winged helix-turn-helix (wHTH) protein/Flp pilus assembly protein TadD
VVLAHHSSRDDRNSAHVWRFADCEVDELRRELRVRGITIDLETKPWEVLHQLLLHAGEVVTKDELLDAVWPGLTVVDNSLATAISKLRKALGDESMILTVPRIGYRLRVPVHIQAGLALVSGDLSLTPGERVPWRDQWRLVRRFDKSPSSEVWLAEQPKTHEYRVFKFASDGEPFRALKREVTLARLLRDSLGERPDFVRVLEWNFDKSPYFVESEYVGPNLAEWADSQGGLHRMGTDQRLSLFIGAVQAVAAAHSLDVLHKDLKPANILVAKGSDGTPQIKIADFGSAALLSPSRLGALGITNLGFTQPNNVEQDSITGTVMYMAPEVLGGQSPTAASDVYALGVLLYQLIAGDFRKPLAPGWEADVSDSLLREDIGDGACGDPTRRIKTAAEFAERLTSLDSRRAKREEAARAQERAQVAEHRRAQARVRLPWLVLAAVAIVAVVAVFISFKRSSPPTSPPAAPQFKSLAVLPFQNMSSDAATDYLRLALPDEITTTLSHTSGLAVRSFSASSKFDQRDIDPQKAGREMRVNSVVTGHFMKQGDRLHITLEAIDVESNGVLWRDTMETPAQSMMATQVQISLRLRMGLVPALGASATESFTKPKNEEAYDLFLRGTALAFDLKSIQQAIQMLERAVKLDPDYAPAWHALALAYSREAHYTNGGQGSLERADAADERALTLDPYYIEARIGRISNRVERGDLVRAYHEAEELVRLYPNKAGARFTLMYVLRYAGLLEESARQCDTAFSVDSKNPSLALRSCAVVFLLQGDYAHALNFLSNYQNHYSGSDYATSVSIEIFLRQGKEQEALQLGLAHPPQWAGYDLVLAYIQHKPASEVRALAERVQASDDPETNYLAAGHLAYAGYLDTAMQMLRAAIKGNYCSYPAMDSDPMFANLRAKPEFVEIRAAGIQCQNNFLSHR